MNFFTQALANPLYGERAKTYMAQGLCQMKAGALPEAEASLIKSYEYDASNPVTGFNLASVLYQKKDYPRAWFTSGGSTILNWPMPKRLAGHQDRASIG